MLNIAINIVLDKFTTERHNYEFTDHFEKRTVTKGNGYLCIHFLGNGKREIRCNETVVLKSDNNVLAFDNNTQNDLIRREIAGRNN